MEPSTSPQTALPRTFCKAERLCSQRAIETLFGSGSKSFSAYPLRAVFRPVPAGAQPVQVLLSVSKRHFKHAVDRNRVKRQLREAYRKHKGLVWQAVARLNERPGEQPVSLHVAFLWLADVHYASADVERKVVNLLHRMAESL